MAPERHVLPTVRVEQPGHGDVPPSHLHCGGFAVTPWVDRTAPPKPAVWGTYGLSKILYSARHQAWQLAAEEEIVTSGWLVIAEVTGPEHANDGEVPTLDPERVYLMEHEEPPGEACRMVLIAH